MKALSSVKGSICADVEWDECEDFLSEALVKLDALKPCENERKQTQLALTRRAARES